MRKTLTIILFLLFAFLLLPAQVKQAYATSNSQVLIINQVRGEECCDEGNFENLKKQVEASISLNIPMTFVARYDALKNKDYINYLKEKADKYPNLISLGILLEYTPNFVNESEVKYRGTNETWFGAENLFSIGYTEEENTKMADNIFSLFKNNFGYYPKVTSSWMIDTSLLNYIHDKYGVKVHQITREQWGTDSYTLDGGPPHYPYPASKNWLFMPDFERSEAPLIVRQTVEDPLFNYGDTTSSFTSQPNDYMRNKNFDYFNSLLDQALFEQPQAGFALLGLENSMGTEFQNEYIKQLELIKSYSNQSLIIFPTIDQLNTFWKNNKTTVYQGRDLLGGTPNYAYWITTPTYRIRVRIKDASVFISDARIYNPAFDDNYKNQTAKREGFWIVPFLLNYAINKSDKENLFSLGNQPMATNKFISISNDSGKNGSRISLPSISKNIKIQKLKNGISFSYESGNKKIAFNFGEKQITSIGLQHADFTYQGNSLPFYPVQYVKSNNGFSLQWKTENSSLVKLNTNCASNGSCEIKFVSDPEVLAKSRNVDYEYLFPDPSNHNLDINKTVFYPNNKYAIAGRNPVRMIIIPYDKYGIVTTFSNNTKITSKNNLKSEKITQGKRYFFDFYSSTPTSDKITMNFGADKKTVDIYFAPNCKKEFKTCIKNPQYLWWYVNTILGDKFRQLFYKEK